MRDPNRWTLPAMRRYRCPGYLLSVDAPSSDDPTQNASHNADDIERDDNARADHKPFLEILVDAHYTFSFVNTISSFGPWFGSNRMLCASQFLLS